jgi:hypothetical protein
LWKYKIETDLNINKYIYKDILLNLITDKKADVSTTFQPFSTSSLNIHIENSLNNISDIPNYLTLLCKKYSSDIIWWKTLVLSMADVLNQLNSLELDLLRNSKIELNNWTQLKTNILEYDNKRWLEFLSFRDFWDYNKDWGIINSVNTKGVITSTISKLYELLYSFDNLYSIPWKEWDLYWLDNKKFLHLRSKQFKSWDRHLQRLRII